MKKDSNYNIMKIDNSVLETQIDTIAAAVETLETTVEGLDYTEFTGYDATKTQVLKNVSGTLTWVTEEAQGEE